MGIVLNFVKTLINCKQTQKRFVYTRWMQYEARSRFTPSTGRECTMYSTDPAQA